MGWTLVTTVNANGATDRNYTLSIPGIGLGASEVLTKINASENITKGSILRYFYRAASGTTWASSIAGLVNPGVASTGYYIADADSLSGTATVSATPSKRMHCSVYRDSLSSTLSSFAPINFIESLNKNGETWTTQIVYGYIDALGATKYTNTSSVAETVGGLRWVQGRVLNNDIINTANAYVGRSFNKIGSFIAAPGATIVLQGNVYANAAMTIVSGTQSATAPFYIGTCLAKDGTGAALKVCVDNGWSNVEYASVFFEPGQPNQMLAETTGFYSSSVNVTEKTNWVFRTNGTWNGTVSDFDTITISIPNISYQDPQKYSAISNSDYPVVPDFCVDVTLPAPLGDFRIVWTAGVDSVAGGTRYKSLPILCRRTTPDSTPYTGAVRSNSLRSYNESFKNTSGQGSSVKGLYDSMTVAGPLAMGSLELTNTTFTNHYVCIGKECFPGAGHVAWQEAPITNTYIEAQWAYWDCSGGTPLWTRVGSPTALSIFATFGGINLWSGTVPAPTWPSDYPQGSFALMLGTTVNSTSQNTCKNYLPSSITLPVYPYDTTYPGWFTGDSDMTLVVNAGWKSSTDRVGMPSPTYGGAATTVVWNGSGITIDQTASTVSVAANKMFSGFNVLSGWAHIISDDGDYWWTLSGWYKIRNPYTFQVTSSVANSFSVINPASPASYPIRVSLFQLFGATWSSINPGQASNSAINPGRIARELRFSITIP